MTAPTVDEREIDEPDGTEEYTPKNASDVEQLRSLLLWCRRNRFAFGVVQLGDITLHGVQDLLPRKGSQVDDVSDDFPPWLDGAARAALADADRGS